MSILKDQSLAESGRRKIRWVRDFMPALGRIEERFAREHPPLLQIGDGAGAFFQIGGNMSREQDTDSPLLRQDQKQFQQFIPAHRIQSPVHPGRCGCGTGVHGGGDLRRPRRVRPGV